MAGEHIRDVCIGYKLPFCIATYSTETTAIYSSGLVRCLLLACDECTFEHHHCAVVLTFWSLAVRFEFHTTQLQGLLPKFLGNLTRLKFFFLVAGLGTIPVSNMKGHNCQMISNDFACPTSDFILTNCDVTNFMFNRAW